MRDGLTFPQELIDEIISYLPRYNRKLLRNCSLAARSCMFAVQRHFFRSVLTRGNLRPWLTCVSQKDGELLKHVRHLTCYRERDFFAARPTELAAHDVPPDLSCSLQLTHLELRYTTVQLPPQEIELFSCFQTQTLTYYPVVLQYLKKLARRPHQLLPGLSSSTSKISCATGHKQAFSILDLTRRAMHHLEVVDEADERAF